MISISISHFLFNTSSSYRHQQNQQNQQNQQGEKGQPIPLVEYTDSFLLEEDFQNEIIHPVDLKNAVAEGINQILAPVREHFKTDPEAKALLDKVKAYKVTK